MPVSWKQLVKKLRDFRFEGPFSGGKHPYMIKDDLVLTRPNPHTRFNLLEKLIKSINVAEKFIVIKDHAVRIRVTRT